MADNLSILLTVEAVDKASSIMDKISGVMDKMSGSMMAASQRASMSASELQMAQDRAAASATAYERALGVQATAQNALRVDTEALTRAQEAQAAAAGQGAAAQAAASAQVEAAAARQVVSLDALSAAEAETVVRAREAQAAQAGLSTELVSGQTIAKGTAVAAGAVAVAVGVIADKSVKAASDFQASMVRLVTSAGESKSAINDLSKGVLQLSVDTATSTEDLAKGLYFIESAGYHSADALKVLQAAAEGARAEGADMTEMANALTTVMKDYGFKTDDATKATDMMVAAVSNGKMTMQQFASSLSTVLPTAKATGISFQETAGAIATLTSQGITAQQATVDLNHIIQKLQSTTSESRKYMAQLGLSADDLSANLGKRGLTGTMEIVLQAIAEHTQGGQVLVSAFNQSKNAAQDMNIMLQQMPPNLRKMSTELESGAMSYAEYVKGIKALDGPQHAMGAQFASLAGQADGFNQQIKTGGPAAMEFTAALKKVVGDQTSLQAALALSSGGLGNFKNIVQSVGDAAQNTGDHVKGWDEIQGTFAFKTSQLKETLHAVMIAIGQGLLPIVSSLVDKISGLLAPLAEWITHHQKLTAGILIVVGVLAALVAVISVVIVVAGSLAIAIDALSISFASLMTATGVGVVLIALGAAALYVATHWTQTKEVLATVWNWIKEQAQTVSDFFVGVWHSVVAKWDEIWSAVVEVVKKYWPLILAPVTGGLSLVVDYLLKHKKQVMDIWNSIWGGIVDAWDATGGKVPPMIKHAWEVVSESVSQEWNRIVDDLRTIWGELVELWNATGGKLVSYISDHWDQISSTTSMIWGKIVAALKQYWDFIWSYISSTVGTAVDFLKVSWDIIFTAAKMAWDLIYAAIKGTLDALWSVIKGAFELMKSGIKTALDTIVMVFEVAWDLVKGVINTALDLIKGILRIFIDIFTGSWGRLWDDVVNTAKTVGSDLWETIKSVFNDIWRWLTSVMGNIKDGIVGAWDAIYQGISGFLTNIWNGIKSAFSDGVNALSGIWNGLKKLAADPVNFVIDTVYNHGIRTLWNDVSGVFGGPQLGSIGKIEFAEGGLVPGVGRADSVPAMLMPGEFVLSHRMIDKLGGMTNIIAALGSGTGGNGKYGGGGGILGAVSGAVGGLVDDVKGVYNWGKDLVLGGLRKAAEGAFGVVNNLLGQIPGADLGFGKEMLSGVKSMESGILDFLGAKDKEAPKGHGEPLDTWVKQAIAATGAPMAWFTALETIAMNESGGVPTAMNDYDINAQNGDPSRGLMQTIGATFNAYHQAGTSDNIYDPVANVAAAINYIRARYGDINNVPGIRSLNRGGAYVGYENGTWDTGPFSQMALLHPREAVLPASVASAARAGGLGGGAYGGAGNVVIDLRGSQVINDRAADELIQKIERRIATRILPAGGTRIRM